MPEYYQTIEVAKYYGVSPLEVMTWPQWIIGATYAVMEGQSKAREKLQKREEAKNKRKRGK